MVNQLWRIVQRFLKTLKIELPWEPAIPFLGKTNSKRHMHPSVQRSTTYNMEAT